jgi:hypothetical protein
VLAQADAMEVIGTAAAAALHGTGSARIGRDLGVPAATVRSWLRRLRSRAGEIRQDAMHQLGFIGGADPALPDPSGSPPGDALNAVAAAAHAAIIGYGFSRSDLWPLLGRFGWQATWRQRPAADHSRPARAPSCLQPGRDAHHDHHGVTRAAHRDTVSTTPPP